MVERVDSLSRGKRLILLLVKEMIIFFRLFLFKINFWSFYFCIFICYEDFYGKVYVGYDGVRRISVFFLFIGLLKIKIYFGMLVNIYEVYVFVFVCKNIREILINVFFLDYIMGIKNKGDLYWEVFFLY